MKLDPYRGSPEDKERQTFSKREKVITTKNPRASYQGGASWLQIRFARTCSVMMAGILLSISSRQQARWRDTGKGKDFSCWFQQLHHCSEVGKDILRRSAPAMQQAFTFGLWALQAQCPHPLPAVAHLGPEVLLSACPAQPNKYIKNNTYIKLNL